MPPPCRLRGLSANGLASAVRWRVEGLELLQHAVSQFLFGKQLYRLLATRRHTTQPTPEGGADPATTPASQCHASCCLSYATRVAGAEGAGESGVSSQRRGHAALRAACRTPPSLDAMGTVRGTAASRNVIPLLRAAPGACPGWFDWLHHHHRARCKIIARMEYHRRRMNFRGIGASKLNFRPYPKDSQDAHFRYCSGNYSQWCMGLDAEVRSKYCFMAF
jgi:hypothetical protein